jgi:hypothetical protein
MRIRRKVAVSLLAAAAGVAGVALAQQSDPERWIDRSQTIDAIAPEQTLEQHRGSDAFDYFGGLRFDESAPAPQDALGYALGDRFTRHHEMVDYMRALGAASDHAIVREYGRTHQDRPLLTMTISSRENLARLDEILEANRALTDPRKTSESEAERIIETNPAIVWLSFGVHGNEASTIEAAMATAHALAAGENEELREIRDNVVVVIDPALNPDGRMRYVSWFENAVGQGGPNPSWDAAEHDEPWPSGRTNHYLFDLNRDWLWLTQPESAARIAEYTKHKPQLHIDIHEQGFRSPYFFGAGDDPYNQNIPEETRAWIELYGKANARLFDARGLVYATKERFDYLYPGYGKVLPVYHGAVGMLTEQAGHGFAGLVVDVHGDYKLTLRERANNHFLTSMNYVETTAANRAGQLRRFWNFHKNSLDPDEGPMAFIISADNDAALLREVKRLADAHGIEIERLDRGDRLRGLRDYRSGEELDRVEVPAGSWIIRADQPMGRLARALFERSTELTSNDTYDITGWSLPVSFGLTAWESSRALRGDSALDDAPETGAVTGDGRYAVLVDSKQSGFPSAVGLAMEMDLFWRFTGAAIEIDGRRFGPGSMIVHRVRNADEKVNDFLSGVSERGVDAHRAGSGLTTAGPVLGTNENGIAQAPKIALLRDEPTDPYSYGELWWFLDLEYGIPHTTINADRFGRIDLDDYNVLVVPSLWGSLDRALGESGADRVRDWVRGGGTLVSIGSSTGWAESSVLQLDEEDEGEKEEEEARESDLTWGERRDRGVDRRVPGSMLAAGVDVTHPLAAGVPEWVGAVKRSPRTLRLTDDVFVLARYDEDPLVSGHLSDERREEIAGTPMIAHHAMGGGHVVLVNESVSIRGFQRAVVRLVVNAMLYGPTL